MSPDENQTDTQAERLRPDAVAPLDEPEQRLYTEEDQPGTADGPDTAEPPHSSPYPDGPASSPYPDGWGPDAVHDQYARVDRQPANGASAPADPYAGQYGAAYHPDPYPPAIKQFDPAQEFEPPNDLPPWYEDEYYDDRDWERLPRRTSTLLRVLVFFAGFVAIVAVAGLYARGWVGEQLDPPGEEGDVVAIVVPQGASTNDIVRILDEEDVVANGTVFRYYLRFKDIGEFQAGEYTFRTNMAVWDVVETLESGTSLADTFLVTVPEGFRLTEIEASLLSQLPSFDAAELSDAFTTVRTPAVFQDAILFSSEGILFPDSYEVDDNSAGNEAALLERMVTRFDQVAIDVELVEGAEALGVSPYQALIVASLIEEEARADEDRAKISRVIYNRLEVGEPLGIDATVVYALGGDRELSASDLAFDSPYNTRLYAGLPPTPISAPGRLSLEAAVNPADGDWFFYVLTEENGPGTHTFAETQEDFNAAVQICVERGLGCG